MPEARSNAGSLRAAVLPSLKMKRQLAEIPEEAHNGSQ